MWLRVLTGDSAGLVVAVRGPLFVVGSDPSCDLVLRDPGVAPRHAVFEQAPHGGYTLTDLGSERGTFVATRRIHAPVHLSGIEELCFGETFAQLYSTRAAARGTRKASRRTRLVVAGAAVLVAGVLAAASVILVPDGDSDAPELAWPALPGDETRTSDVTISPGETLPFAGGAVTEPESSDEPAGADEPAEARDEPARSDEPDASAPPAAETAPEATQREPFADDFSDPGSGWEVFDEAAAFARYEQGGFVMYVGEEGAFATADSGREYEHPVVRVIVAPVRGPGEAAFGIVCGYRDQQNFDALAATTDGRAAILTSENGRLRVLSNGGAWRRAAAVPTGASTYSLRAECAPKRLRLAVNGTVVASAPRPAKPGRIGFFVTGDRAVRFDDLQVTEAS